MSVDAHESRLSAGGVGGDASGEKIASSGLGEEAGDAEGERQARIVAAGLDGVDGLT